VLSNQSMPEVKRQQRLPRRSTSGLASIPVKGKQSTQEDQQTVAVGGTKLSKKRNRRVSSPSEPRLEMRMQAVHRNHQPRGRLA